MFGLTLMRSKAQFRLRMERLAGRPHHPKLLELARKKVKGMQARHKRRIHHLRLGFYRLATSATPPL